MYVSMSQEYFFISIEVAEIDSKGLRRIVHLHHADTNK